VISEPTSRPRNGAAIASNSTAQIHRSIRLVRSSRSQRWENGSSNRTPYALVRSSARCVATATIAAAHAPIQRTGLRAATRTSTTGNRAITGIAASECVRCR